MELDQKRLFAGVPRGEIQVLLDAGAQQTFLAGDVIFDEGDPGDALWIIESGTVEVFKTIHGGLDRVLGTFSAGSVFGEMSFVDASRRSAGARATEATNVLMLTRAAFDDVAEQHAKMAATFFKGIAMVMAERLRLTNDAYKQSVVARLEATGTAPLNLHRYVEELRVVTIHLIGGAPVTGNLLGLEHQPPGWALLIKDGQDRVSLIPYHAVVRVEEG